MTLRARLTLSAAAAVALAVVLASIAVYFVVRSELRGEVDDALKGRANTIVRPFDDDREFPDVPPPILGGPGGYVQLVTADGSSARERGSNVALPVNEHTQAVAAGTKGAYFSDATVAGTRVRILTVPYRNGLALQIARPLTEVDDVLSRLRWILLLVACAGVGIAALLGLAVARSALAPTRRLTETAEEITETGDLSRRVETDRTDELGRLAAAFNTMLGALEGSVEAQRRLVSDASHELRTPLTSLRTNVALLGRPNALRGNERKRVLADVDAEIEELSRLVTDVVDLARDGEPQLAVEDVRLDLVVADAVERARRHAPDVPFETELEESVVRGTPERIHRAVANLLDNAAKWSAPGRPVDVAVQGNAVTVRDHGTGIPADDLPHVFDRFYRATEARGMPGSGLGLAIVRQVAESHGGHVSVEAADGGGTIFRLVFTTAP